MRAKKQIRGLGEQKSYLNNKTTVLGFSGFTLNTRFNVQYIQQIMKLQIDMFSSYFR